MRRPGFLTLRKTVCGLLIVMSANLAFASFAPAQTKVTWVRGKVEWKGKPNYPAGKIAVTIVPRDSRTDKSKTKLVYTSSSGMYDFHVASGTYVLTVRWSEKNSKSFLIDVRNQSNLDIGAIVIP
jgi:hypothetical protein